MGEALGKPKLFVVHWERGRYLLGHFWAKKFLLFCPKSISVVFNQLKHIGHQIFHVCFLKKYISDRTCGQVFSRSNPSVE